MFGPYAAQVLAAHVEQPVAEAMAYLDEQLAVMHGTLEPIMAALAVRFPGAGQRVGRRGRGRVPCRTGAACARVARPAGTRHCPGSDQWRQAHQQAA